MDLFCISENTDIAKDMIFHIVERFSIKNLVKWFQCVHTFSTFYQNHDNRDLKLPKLQLQVQVSISVHTKINKVLHPVRWTSPSAMIYFSEKCQYKVT